MRILPISLMTKFLSWSKSIFKRKSDIAENPLDRSHERYRRAALGTIAAGVNRAVSLGASLITVTLTFRYLGAERYGMWVTITSAVSLIGFADLGINNGLITIVADAFGREDYRAARSAVSSAFWMLSGLALCLATLCFASYPFINGAKLFNVHSVLAIHESSPTLLVLLLCFIVNFPLGVIRGVQTGLQNQFINNVWMMLGSIASLILLLLSIHLHAGLPILVLCLSGAPILGMLANGVELFSFSHPELLPSPQCFSRQAARQLLSTGVLYFVLQIAWAIGVQTDNIVIAQILGAKMVASYAVPARLFNIIPSLLVVMSAPMWPAYADAIARSDGQWVRRAFRRVITVCGTVTLALSIVLVLFGNRIIRVWVGPQIHASESLLIALGLLGVLSAYLNPIIFLLNGAGELKVLTFTDVVSSIVNVSLSIVFVKEYGIIGAAMGTIAGFIIRIIPVSIVTRKVLQRLNQAA